jgi:HD-like signal output (HDOD) protein
MNLGASPNPQSGTKRLVNDAGCVLAITEALNGSGEILRMLKNAIRNPRTTIPEVADILSSDRVLSTQIVTFANTVFPIRTSNLCKTIEEALRLVGLREITRLIATATTEDVIESNLRA